MAENSSKIKKIAIFGGSFNPPHKGHLHISRIALKKLDVDELWWVVSNYNPMKNYDGFEYAEFDKRLKWCQEITKYNNKIIIKTDEYENNIYNSIDLIHHLKNTYHNHKFAFIIGSDNMYNFHLWNNYDDIMQEIPLAIFQRYRYNNYKKFKFFAKYKNQQVTEKLARHLIDLQTPSWCFINNSFDASSSTQIRNKNKNWNI